MQEFREIQSARWENNRIVGFKLVIMVGGQSSTFRYMTLKELYDEQSLIHVDTKLGKREPTDNPVLLLKYLNKESGGSASAFVYVVKIGDQYEIRDVKDNKKIIHTLLELPKE